MVATLDPEFSLKTQRLILNRLSADDADFIYRLVNTPSWLKYIGDKKVRTLADASSYIITGPIASYQRHGFGLYAVRLKENAEPIGMCGLIKRDYLDDVDIGFALFPEYTGMGFAFEAASAVMHYGKEFLKLRRIVAITTTDNILSMTLLKKLGLDFEKKIKAPDGEDLMLFVTGKSHR
ncbi:MAG: GNAT family N-acetyltransferase [Bacteroidota bacterium]